MKSPRSSGATPLRLDMDGARNAHCDSWPGSTAPVVCPATIGGLCAALDWAASGTAAVRPGSIGNRDAAAGCGRIAAGAGNQGPVRRSCLDRAFRIWTGGDCVTGDRPQSAGSGSESSGHRTRDLGFVHRDSFLFVAGQANEVLMSGDGKKVAPEDLEPIYGGALEITEVAGAGRQWRARRPGTPGPRETP
jgi:acyl-CoA synthetase (AMP-forming)/AMP-acid ligase II